MSQDEERDEGQSSDLPTLTITFNPATNQCEVTGPLMNRFLCYGMLEMARDVIVDWNKHKQREQQRILDAVGMPGGGVLPFDPKRVQ